MRDLIEEVLLALILGVALRTLREIKRIRDYGAADRLYCDDDGELLPITVVNEDDRRAN